MCGTDHYWLGVLLSLVLYCCALSCPLYFVFSLNASQWRSRVDRVLNLNLNIRLCLFWSIWTWGPDSPKCAGLAHRQWRIIRSIWAVIIAILPLSFSTGLRFSLNCEFNVELTKNPKVSSQPRDISTAQALGWSKHTNLEPSRHHECLKKFMLYIYSFMNGW